MISALTSGKYQAFWANTEDPPIAWFAQLCAIGSLGAELSGQTHMDTTTVSRSEHLRRLTARALALADCTKPQSYLLEALLLHLTSVLFKHHDVTTQVWHLIGLAIRLCYQAGYHRDPGRNPNITPFECEMRRRVWMVACELDIWISYTLGTVIPIHHKLCDTAPPANLFDTDFSPDQVPPSRLWEDYTLVQTEYFYAKIAVLFGDITLLAHAVQPPEKSEVQAMYDRLLEEKSQLPRNLVMVPLDQCFMDSPRQIVDRFRFDFAYQTAVCVLYSRSVANSIGGAGCSEARDHRIRAARTIVKHSISMLEAVQPGGLLAQLKILVVRHIHDFNLAAIMLCLELKHLTTGSDAETLRQLTEDIRPKLIHACSLWNSPDIPSPKARNAIETVLRFLRQGCRAQAIQSDVVAKDVWPDDIMLTNGIPSGNAVAAPYTIDETYSWFEQTQGDVPLPAFLEGVSFEYDTLLGSLTAQTGLP